MGQSIEHRIPMYVVCLTAVFLPMTRLRSRQRMVISTWFGNIMDSRFDFPLILHEIWGDLVAGGLPEASSILFRWAGPACELFGSRSANREHGNSTHIAIIGTGLFNLVMFDFRNWGGVPRRRRWSSFGGIGRADRRMGIWN